MKVNKRKCRKYADPGLKLSPGSGLLCMEKLRYIIRTAVKNIAGKRTLLLYFYDRAQAAQGLYVPVFTMFQTKDDYATLEQISNGKGKWRTSSLERMGGYYNAFDKISAFYSPKDEQRVIRFFESFDNNGFVALYRKQQTILDKRTRQRTLAKERIIIEKMKRVPALPGDLKGFIRREVLPAYVFYTYHKSKKPMEGYCSACRHDVLVTGAKHNKAGVCPLCKREITFKASSRISTLWNQATAQVIQKISDDELLVRIFKVHKSYRSGFREPREEIWESARLFVRHTGDKKLSVSPYYYAHGRGILTHWKKGTRPILNKWAVNFEGDVCGYLYHRNLDEVLLGTPWQYSQLKAFCLKDREPLEVLPYLRCFVKYPMLEYLVKLGLFRIASHAVYRGVGDEELNPRGKKPTEILGVSAQDIPLLQKINANINQLALLRDLRKQNIRADAALLRWCEDFAKHQREDLLFALRFITPLKLMRYIGRQYEKVKDERVTFGYLRYENAGRILSEYKDYLQAAVKLEYDLKNSFVLFPRNLKKAHDFASDLYQERETEINDRLISDAYPSLLKQYGFTKNGLTVLPPKTAQEIVAEGHALHHCVGTYISKVVDGESVILFIRRKEAPETPFYTMELRGGAISQARGQNNGAQTPEVEKYLALFERKVLRAASLPKAA